MSLLLLMLITTAFWVVPTDSMDKFWKNNAKIEANLNKIFEESTSNEEKIRNEGAYEILQHFTDGKIKKHSENLLKMSNAQAKVFLDQISFAIKDNVIKSEVNGKWICAEKIPSKVKEALKFIKERIFKINNAEINLDKEYADNIKQFLMILSVAVRICAMIRPNNELQTFLTAYKCSSEDQSQTPPIMYSFDILPNYSSDKIGKLGHSTSEISSISLNTDISAKSKQNFNFLLKLSKIELTPFSILNLAKKLMMSLHLLRAYINIEHPTIYDLVIAHFYREYRPISGLHPVVFWSSDCCNLTNFMLQLMNRVKESPNLSEYFVHAEFSTELEQQLGEFHNLEKKYSIYCKEDNVQKVIKKHQDFLHFAEAVHVNWNPYKELLITLQTFKYVYFCSKEGLDYFRSIANPFDQEQKLLKDLVKEGHETEKDRELMNIIQSNCHRLELDKLMPKLQTLENFKKIQQNYEYLKTFEQLLDERKNEKLAFDSLVILNAELEKAKTFCMEKI